jgi:DNA-binding FadR family transcriptional regulator
MSGQNLSGKIKDLFGSVVSDSDRLPNERDLALKFGVSRHAVRKALERLEIEGQLWRHVGRGTFRGQRPNPATSDADVVIQHASLREIVETRKIIEPQIAALAAVRASAAQVGAIEDAARRCGAAKNMDQYEVWDENFHRALANATGNVILQSIFETVNRARKKVVWGTMRRAALRPGRRDHFSQEHARVVEAIRNRNPDAAWDAMRIHMETLAEVYASLEQSRGSGRLIIF